jgi:hypothetical protein
MTEKPKVNPVVECEANTVPVVPDDWAALGAKSGYDPKPAKALRLFIVGPSGEGKTTFLSSISDTLIFDFDDGANAIPGGRATRISIRDYAHFDSIIDKLVADAKANNRRFARVGTDTIDELIAMIKHKLEEEKGVEDITDYRSEGYGYNLILQRFWSKILDLEHAGYAWAINGHMKTKTEVDPATKKPVTKIRESVYPGVAKKILSKADFKLTIYCIPKTIERTVEKILPGGRKIQVPAGSETKLTYYLDSLTTEARDGKSRGVPSMERKFELPLIGGWDVFKEKYEAAVKVEKKRHT